MNVKAALWGLSVLLFWIVWLAIVPIALANSPARGTSGCVDDTWTATGMNDAPSGRQYHTVVWTDTEMLVWGGVGSGSSYLNTGGRYNPATDTWTTINLARAPNGRANHTAVWTGTEMLVWGGFYADSVVRNMNTGGRYCASAGMEGKLDR